MTEGLFVGFLTTEFTEDTKNCFFISVFLVFFSLCSLWLNLPVNNFLLGQNIFTGI